MLGTRAKAAKRMGQGDPKEETSVPSHVPRKPHPVRFVGNSNNTRYLYRCAQAECQTNVQRAFGYLSLHRKDQQMSPKSED